MHLKHGRTTKKILCDICKMGFSQQNRIRLFYFIKQNLPSFSLKWSVFNRLESKAILELNCQVLYFERSYNL